MTDESIKFLESDFNQCFEQMRYYDSQIVGTLKFQFAGYTTLIGLTLGIIKYGEVKEVDFSFPISAFLIVGLIIGVLLYAIMIRNRVYFVHLARYINEIRSKFLSSKPLGIENTSKMYTNSTLPQFYNFRSSQAWYVYIVSTFNATLGFMLGIINYSQIVAWIIFFFLIILQLSSGILYLCSREGKTIEKSVFGKD